MWRLSETGGGSSKSRFPPVEGPPAAARCRGSRDAAPSDPGGACPRFSNSRGGVVIEPRRGCCGLPSLQRLFYRSWTNFWMFWVFPSGSPAAVRRVKAPSAAFSEAGSWHRDLAAASASAAAAAAPAQTGPAASWSWTRWTAEDRG